MKSDFTYGYWLNGWRKNPSDASPDVLCIETGRYGLMLDVADLTTVRFGLLEHGSDYAKALMSGTERLAALESARLVITVDVNGTEYRAVRCRAATSRYVSRLKDVKLWESGRLVQHFELFDVVFEDADGCPLGCLGSLHLVAWPDRFALTAELSPDLVYRDGPLPGVTGAGLCIVEKPLQRHAPLLSSDAHCVELWFKTPEFCAPEPKGWLLCWNGKDGFSFDGRRVVAVMSSGGGAVYEHRIPQKRWAMTANQWHHLVMTYDGAEMRFYVDGDLQGAKAFDQPRRPETGSLWLGQQPDDGTPTIRGIYDQVRLWDRALSEAQVVAHSEQPSQLASRLGLVFEDNFTELEGQTHGIKDWQDAELSIGFATPTQEWREQKRISGLWKAGEAEQLSVLCDLRHNAANDQQPAVRVSTAAGDCVPVAFEAASHCLTARVRDLKRGSTAHDLRNYDEFTIEVEQTGEAIGAVPCLLEMFCPASVTGLCPILCDEDGVPTGIPVQLSKNWHEPSLGAYLRAYVLLPTQPGVQRFLLRVVYGFYGTLPSASHAQLSLVGWGCNGRWDQLAIGSWGETFCLDMDLSATEQTVTDVRAMLVRNGADGPKWGWSEAGWGGDWLHASDSQGARLRFSELKTAYLAHGPCLSDVQYMGTYGEAREVSLDATVQTLRTDDYVRTFQTLRYALHADLDVGWLLKMGNTHNLKTSRVAYGNRGGLLAELEGPVMHGVGDAPIEPGTGALTPTFSTKHLPPVVNRLTLDGDGPWWVAFPGAEPIRFAGRENFGTASRAMVIRHYRASFAGQLAAAPTLHMNVHTFNLDGTPNIDLLLMPPPGVETFTPGDWVELDAEWITLPRVAEDYYGPNEALRKHLEENPRSWKTVHREAAGNALGLTVTGGTVTHNYPVIIQAEAKEVSVTITGGVGVVPIRFDGLATAEGYALYDVVDGQDIKLDQSVHGNDFWQTDFDAGSNTYKMTFNLPLDGRPSSTWRFTKTL